MKKLIPVLLVMVLIIGSSPVKADVVTDWNETALQAIRVAATAPPEASRALAITHAAIFDSVNSIYSTYKPYYEKLPGYGTASPEAAAAWAGYTALSKLFPKQTFSKPVFSNTPGEIKGKNLGITIATNIFNWRDGDGWNVPLDPPYEPKDPTVAGRWQPTPPDYLPFQHPQWGSVTPFARLDNNITVYRQGPPPDLTSDRYTAEFNEVKAIGALNSATRTAEQTEIAFFWLDGPKTETPPGHWNSIAQKVAQSRGSSLYENARTFALLNLALGDAAIASWDMKREYDFWRPITGIQQADIDGNPLTDPDPTWEPLVTTPAFPSYVSGHSTFSGAAAAILAELFGDGTAFSSESDGLPGVTRYYLSFSQAALEAGKSRIYGGIHWECDNEFGLKAGDELGTYIYANYLVAPLPGTLVMSLSGLVGIFLAGRRMR